MKQLVQQCLAFWVVHAGDALCESIAAGPRHSFPACCNIVFISDKINTRVVSNIIEQEVSTPETVKDTFG